MIYDLLYDWQKKLVDKIKDKKEYGLFLDMGLGKTPISLALAEANEVDKIIIITINSKAIEKEDASGSWLNWVSKMKKPYKQLTKNNCKSESEEEVLLINYEWLTDRKADRSKVGIQLRPELLSFIKSCYYKKVAIICDESHKIKSSQSAQTKCVQKLWRMLNEHSHAYLYLLTGTPFTQGYIDLYTQLRLLGLPMNKEQFKDNFCIMDHKYGLLDWQQPIKAYKNLDILFKLIHQYAITIKSNEVIDLPEQIFVKHEYSTTDAVKLFTTEHMYCKDIHSIAKKLDIDNELPEETDKRKINNPYFRNMDYPDSEWLAETPSDFWLRTRELSIGFQGNSESYKFYDYKRYKLLEKFLTENEDNYLLFYSYNAEFIELYNLCEKLGYKIDVYSGTIKVIDYYEKYNALSEGGKLIVPHKNILLTNWMSGSTGMNFQAYNKCIIFDLPVYRDWEQGLKRIHRIGQKQTCIYHIFMQNCWLDKNMMKAIEEQRTYTKETFESDLKRVQGIINH